MKVFHIEGMDLVSLAEMASRADAEGKPLRVMADGDGFKFAVGAGMWTVPYGDRKS